MPARVRVTRHVQIGRRRFPVKRVVPFWPVVRRSSIEAATPQLRVLAEESREFIIDKLCAATPQSPPLPPPQQQSPTPVARPPRLRASNLPTASRQPFQHRPLQDYVVQRKADAGLDLRKLIETGEYIRSFEVFKGERSATGVYYMMKPRKGYHVGWRQKPAGPSRTRPRVPITYMLLARVHEYGSIRHRIPPRPHWRPTTRAVSQRFRALAPDIQADALRRSLRRLR